MSFAELITQSLHLDTTNGAAIKQFIKRFDLVYFGKVDHRYDDHAVVRGVTASAQHIDKHFAVGNIKGRDVSILERTNTLHFPNKPSQEYNWVIVQVDLKEGLELPHIFIDAHHHDEVFYANLFVNFSNFQKAHSLFVNDDPLFNERFNTYTPFDKFDDSSRILQPEVTSMLAHHFAQFDYEMQEDMLYIYCSNQKITEKEIERMARIGLWLADAVEKNAVVLQ